MENNLVKIKSFIYLDENKMFSISSQLFEGITQYILKEDTEAFEEQNEQKGRFLSGRFMADMMLQRAVRSEMTYLHDFAFNLFEKELIARDMLHVVTNTDTIDSLNDKKLVKVSGKLVFSDYGKLRDTIDHFNDLGRAFGELQYSSVAQNIDVINNAVNQIKDREHKNKQKQVARTARIKFDDFLKENGLMMDDKYMKNLSTIMRYGYHDKYEMKFEVKGSDLYCTAVTNSTYLKEPEEILVSRYSRMTELPFSCIGIITQIGNEKANLPEPMDNDIKNATQRLTGQIANLEAKFNGRCSNEFVVDPIAIFTEL